MTNYSERLDEVLSSLAHRAYLTAHAPGYTKLDGRTYKTAVDDTKQALTSLIKELVAEAKPKNNWLEGSDLFYGQDEGVGEFEQNLLKELEEV